VVVTNMWTTPHNNRSVNIGSEATIAKKRVLYRVKWQLWDGI
jgi:hypothetical protein